MSRRLIELSHVIRDGMITYPGIPGPQISDHLSRADSRGHYAPGTEFQFGRITLVANTGTYLDTPFHRYADGVDLAEVAIDAVADLDGIVIPVTETDSPAIDRAALTAHEVTGRAVLIHSGWDRAAEPPGSPMWSPTPAPRRGFRAAGEGRACR